MRDDVRQGIDKCGSVVERGDTLTSEDVIFVLERIIKNTPTTSFGRKPEVSYTFHGVAAGENTPVIASDLSSKLVALAPGTNPACFHCDRPLPFDVPMQSVYRQAGYPFLRCVSCKEQFSRMMLADADRRVKWL